MFALGAVRAHARVGVRGQLDACKNMNILTVEYIYGNSLTCQTQTQYTVGTLHKSVSKHNTLGCSGWVDFEENFALSYLRTN